METFSLFQLNEYIRRVIALNFDDTIWINAEISQVNYSRGNYYLELIEKEEGSDKIKAKASANLWYKKSLFLRKKFKDIFDSILDTGNEIRVKVKVEFNERYGFSLIIEDLDASYTLGKAELVKQQILNKLTAENVLHLNGQLELPISIQKIAIVSSETAAGYKDFMSHLDTNSFGYKYETELFQSSMQGQAVEKELIAALDEIENGIKNYDCIVIIRGGGAKLDLAAFDNYAIAKRIAFAKLPVITGIGHDIDSSIADIVSHTDLKTPTAVADFIIERSLTFESRLLDYGLKIQIAFKEIMASNNSYLDLMQEQVKSSSRSLVQQNHQFFNEALIKIENFTSNKISRSIALLDSYAKQIELLSPENVMKRGFSIARQNGKAIRSKKDLDAAAFIETEFIDGIIKSKIQK